VVVPKVRNEDDYLGISTWGEALDAIDAALRNVTAGGLAVIACLTSPFRPSSGLRSGL